MEPYDVGCFPMWAPLQGLGPSKQTKDAHQPMSTLECTLIHSYPHLFAALTEQICLTNYVEKNF